MQPIVKTINLENGDILHLTYEMTQRNDAPDYGLRVTAERRIPAESVEFPSITTNLLEIEQLLVVLSTYSVTPATVSDILDDLGKAIHLQEK